MSIGLCVLVVDFVTRHFVPVRVHVKHNAEAFATLGERFNAQWTPTILIIDSSGAERHVESHLVTDAPSGDRLRRVVRQLVRGCRP